MANSATLDAAIIQEFCTQFGAKPQGGGKRYKDGICPKCGKKSFWIWGTDAYKARCDRTKNCNHEISTRELFPKLFQSYSKRYEIEMLTDPKAGAKAYLRDDRGFNLALVDTSIFTQETFTAAGNSTATVRFAMQNNGEMDGYWERFIDNPKNFFDKARFMKGYKYAGLAWVHPDFDATKCDEIWITEGIFDALALRHIDITAISAMSANNFPETTLKEILSANSKIKLVVALDSEEKTKKTAINWHKKLIDLGFNDPCVAITNEDTDWNDWLIQGKLTDKGIEKALFHGALLIAKSPSVTAKLIWKTLKQHKFFFEFNYKTYWFEFNPKNFNQTYNTAMKQLDKQENEELSTDEKEELENQAFTASKSITEIANCIIDILYYQFDRATEESFYYTKVQMSEQKSAKSAFLPKQLGSGSEFKNKVMAVLSGAIYTGETHHLNDIFTKKTKHIIDIETIKYIGYCKDYKAYIFNDFAVADGIIYKKNNEDYFELGIKNIKSTFDMTSLRPVEAFNIDWFNDFMIVFGTKGLICLTFWFGSLFAEQLRDRYGAWPFLEITGEAGAGKSFLIEFLWSLVGRSDYEGINPTTASNPGRYRTLSQVSNLPIVLIESDTNDPNASTKHKQKTFSFDEIKPLFNGRSPRVLGVKSSNNNTDDEPFRGAVVISQNNKVSGSEAILSRLIYIYYDKSHHQGQYSRDAAERLQRLSTDDVSGFLFEVLKKEKSILSNIEETFNTNRDVIMKLPNMKTERIGLTHGLLMSCLQALCDILPITDNVKAKASTYIHELAVEREKDLVSDNPSIDQFWDVYEYFESFSINTTNVPNKAFQLNHSSKDNEIAINLNEFYDVALRNNQQLDDIKRIKKIISTSIRYPYVGTKTLRSAIRDGKPTYCYLFNKKENS